MIAQFSLRPVGGGQDAIVPLIELVKVAVHLVDGHRLGVHDDPVHHVVLAVLLLAKLGKHFCYHLMCEDILCKHILRRT